MMWAKWLSVAFGVSFLSIQHDPQSGTAAPSATVHNTDDADIVVTAPKAIDTVTAHVFVKQVSVPVEGQLARYEGAVCPGVVGFPQRLAEPIADRMRELVVAVGAKLDAPKCRANMVLFVARDGAALIQKMRRARHVLLLDTEGRDIDREIKTPGPVHSFTALELQDVDGNRVRGAGYLSNGGGVAVKVYSASRMNPQVRQSIDAAVVILDWSALPGKSTRQIADYATIRMLAKTRPVSGRGAVPSILSLFDPAATSLEPELSQADYSYLQGLYHMRRPHYDYFQIGEIARQVKKDSVGLPSK